MTVDYRQFVVDWTAFTRRAQAEGSVIAALQIDERPLADEDEDEAPPVVADVTTDATASGGLRSLAIVALRHLRDAIGGEAFSDAVDTLFWDDLDGEMTCDLPDPDALQIDCVENVFAPASVEALAKAWASARFENRAADIAAAAERLGSSRLTPAVFAKFLYDWKRALDVAAQRRAGFVQMVYD